MFLCFLTCLLYYSNKLGNGEYGDEIDRHGPLAGQQIQTGGTSDSRDSFITSSTIISDKSERDKEIARSKKSSKKKEPKSYKSSI